MNCSLNITLFLFPEDPIVIRKQDDVWTFEGRLKQNSVERFQ